MVYELTGVVRRVVEEEFVVTVEADSQDEAADLTYTVLSEYPDSELSSARLLCTSRKNVEEPQIVDIVTSAEVANDLEEEYFE